MYNKILSAAELCAPAPHLKQFKSLIVISIPASTLMECDDGIHRTRNPIAILIVYDFIAIYFSCSYADLCLWARQLNTKSTLMSHLLNIFSVQFVCVHSS